MVDNSLHEEFSLLSSVALIRCQPSRLNSRYLLQYILSSRGQRRLKDLMAGNAITRLTLQKIKDFTIPIPPAEDQAAIAAILDTVDEAIAAAEAVLAKLKQVRAGLLHDLLTRGLDEHGQLRDPLAHPEQFQDSPLKRIPSAWKVLALRDCLIGSPQNGIYKPAREIGYGALLVGQTSITDDRFVNTSLARRAGVSPVEIERYGLRVGDVLVSRVTGTSINGRPLRCWRHASVAESPAIC